MMLKKIAQSLIVIGFLLFLVGGYNLFVLSAITGWLSFPKWLWFEIGLDMLFVGGFLYIRSQQEERLRQLLTTGLPLVGTYMQTVEVAAPRNSINNAYSIEVEAALPDSGEKKLFKSRTIFQPRAPQLTAGQEIMVYINPQNPAEYYIDTAAFKELKS